MPKKINEGLRKNLENFTISWDECNGKIDNIEIHNDCPNVKSVIQDFPNNRCILELWSGDEVEIMKGIRPIVRPAYLEEDDILSYINGSSQIKTYRADVKIEPANAHFGFDKKLESLGFMLPPDYREAFYGCLSEDRINLREMGHSDRWINCIFVGRVFLAVICAVRCWFGDALSSKINRD